APPGDPVPRACIYRPQLRGRSALLDDVSTRIAKSSADNACVVVITGESGSGRTRFAKEIVRRARALGATAIAGSANNARVARAIDDPAAGRDVAGRGRPVAVFCDDIGDLDVLVRISKRKTRALVVATTWQQPSQSSLLSVPLPPLDAQAIRDVVADAIASDNALILDAVCAHIATGST